MMFTHSRITNWLYLPIAVSIIIAFVLGPVHAIQCYQCSVGSEPRANKTLLCAHFDESDKYIRECPHSTMCEKTVLRSLIEGKTVETILRDCAKQKYVEQVFRNGGWEKEITIEEPYTETCETLEESGPSGRNKIYCHCRGNLCNSAPKELLPSYHTDAMAVIFVFNAMKYVRSLD